MKQKIFSLCLLIAILNVPGYSCKLRTVNLSKDTSGIALKISFQNLSGKEPAYETKIVEHDEYFVLNYSIQGCENKVSKMPNAEYPIMHIEAISGENSQDGNLNLNVYLKNKPPVEHTFDNSHILSSFAVLETFPDEEPKVVQRIGLKSESSNTLTMKYAFDGMPSIKQAFLNKSKTTAVFLFANAANTQTPKKPKVAFIKDFKIKGGLTFSGVPYTKVVITSENEMFFTISPEVNTYVVELYGQQSGPTATDSLSAPVAATTYVPKEGSSGIDVEAYEKKQTNYETKSTAKSVAVWGLGIALVGGGGYLAWEKLKPGPEVIVQEPIPLPDATIFP